MQGSRYKHGLKERKLFWEKEEKALPAWKNSGKA
jgi:hypothetical protein